MTPSGYWQGKIKVVCVDGTVFPVDPRTLEATSTGLFEPDGNHSEPTALEVISHAEWSLRLNQKWDRDLNREFYANQ